MAALNPPWPNMHCSELGGGGVVAMVASRAPGR